MKEYNPDIIDDTKSLLYQQEEVVAALNNSGIYLFRYFPKERTAYIDESAVQAFGCKRVYSNMPDSFAADMVLGADLKTYYAIYDAIAHDERSASAEFRLKGDTWCKVTLTVTRTDSVGKAELCIGIIENRSEVKSIEQQLRIDNATTLRVRGVGAWRWEHEPGKELRLYLDEIARGFFGVPDGITPEECIKIIDSRMYPDDVKGFFDYVGKLIAGQPGEHTYRFVHPERGLRYIRCSAWYDSGYKGYGCIKGIHEDVTDLVLQEQTQKEALQSALVAAERANMAKTTFLSNMSHDIRTPMNAIIGFATIAAGHIDETERIKDCIDKILTSSEHLQGLINEILDMSRIEAGKVSLDVKKTSWSEIIRSVMPLVQPQIQNKRLSFRVDALTVRDNFVYADPLRLRQILVNILGNAAKFTAEGGNIDLRLVQLPCTTEGFGKYRLLVRDNGIGMSEEFLTHIFEPFEREQSSTVSGVTGTGLGMPICKSLVDMMGGSMTVTSALGEGSEFVVELELKLRDDVPADNTDSLKGMRVLVACRDTQTGESIAGVLAEAGLRPEWTADCEDAISRAKEAHDGQDSFGAYVIDRSMPGISGMELTRKIRSVIGDSEPTVVLVVYERGAVEKEALAAGVTHFCAKPLFISELTNALLGKNAKSKAGRTAVYTPVKPDIFAGVRVLLVEDNELNRMLLVELLRETGMVLDTACDGRNALDILNRSEQDYYSLVLMDIQMPVMNGYEATAAIRASERADIRELPVIAMTANAFSEDVKQALSVGMNDHLTKPLDMSRVISTISKYVRTE